MSCATKHTFLTHVAVSQEQKAVLQYCLFFSFIIPCSCLDALNALEGLQQNT